MKISIRSFRRVERADIAGGPIVLVGGHNNAGKSSILLGVALSAVGWGLPQGVAKKNAGEFILHGHETAMVSLSVGDGVVRTSYPKVESVYDGTMRVSSIAAGLTSLARMKPDELAEALGVFIGSSPTLDDILNEVSDLKLPTDLAGKIWGVIEQKGWEGACRTAQENGIKLKGFWEQTTGKPKWGSKLGQTWRPDGWDDALLSESIDEADLVELRRAVQAARENSAVDSAEIDRLTKGASTVEADNEAVTAAETELAAAEADLVAAEAERKGLPVPDDGGGDMPCPHCGGILRLERIDAGAVKLVAQEAKAAIGADALKKMRTAIARADGNIANIRVRVGTAKSALINAKVAASRSREAAEALEVAASKTGGGVSADELARTLAEKERKFALLHQAREAARLHGLVEQNVLLQGLLAPDGLRQKVLLRGLSKFNSERLAPICTAAGWAPVIIAPDMTVRFGDHAWSSLGESAQWIVERVLQVAIAKLDGSALVIMDGADVCDSKNRNKLFGMLLGQSGFETLIGMTFNKPELMPKLGTNGACYWVEDGNARSVS